MRTRWICKDCGNPFTLKPGKPGYINQCPDCSTEKVTKVGGIVEWQGKQTPVLHIVESVRKAKAHNQAHRRFGVGPMRVIAPQGAETDNPGTKQGTGAGFHDTYITKSGEKRSVRDKRKKN